MCLTAMESPAADYHHAVVHEMFLKDADLTGAGFGAGGGFGNRSPRRGRLAWVRLEPIEKLPEVGAAEIEHPLGRSRRMRMG